MWMIIATMHGMNNIKHIKVHKVYDFKSYTLSSEPYRIVFILDNFRKVGNLQYDAKNCILSLIYKSYMGSRWYTSDLHLVIRDIQAFVLVWCQGLKPGGDETDVKHLFSAGARLLHFIVCCKLLVSQVVCKGSEETYH
jgi:hypothetical protein